MKRFRTLFGRWHSMPDKRLKKRPMKEPERPLIDRGLVRCAVQSFANIHRLTYEGAHYRLSQIQQEKPQVELGVSVIPQNRKAKIEACRKTYHAMIERFAQRKRSAA